MKYLDSFGDNFANKLFKLVPITALLQMSRTVNVALLDARPGKMEGFKGAFTVTLASHSFTFEL
jgi:hypothetical protein